MKKKRDLVGTQMRNLSDSANSRHINTNPGRNLFVFGRGILYMLERVRRERKGGEGEGAASAHLPPVRSFNCRGDFCASTTLMLEGDGETNK